MRPVASGTGSASHRLAEVLAKHLSKLMGLINKAHLKYLGDLLNRVREVPIKNKKIYSLDVPSLFTSVPLDKAIRLLNERIVTENIELLPHSDFVDLVEICV